MSLSNPQGMVSPSPRGSSAWSALVAVCVLVFIAGCAIWTMLAVSGDAARAWRAVLINFLYFFPLAVGMMIWPAIVRSSRGRWAGGVMRRTAFSAVTFAPASILLFVLLFFGREHWATWIHHARPPQQAWLNQPFVFIRDGAGILLLWILGSIFVRRSGRGADTPYLSPWLVFTFCIVLTIIGLDMVMSLQPKWYSALFGVYFFVSSAYAGLAAWTLALLVGRVPMDPNRRHDLGKLMVAFGLLTTYMMYSQLIVIWYENLPKEVVYAIPRLRLTPWQIVSAVLLGVIYLGPLVFLLPRREAQPGLPCLRRRGVAGGDVGRAMVAHHPDFQPGQPGVRAVRGFRRRRVRRGDGAGHGLVHPCEAIPPEPAQEAA